MVSLRICGVVMGGEQMAEYIVKEAAYPLATRQEIVGELIRCKDCKYWERRSICDGYCDAMRIHGCDEEFYCGYAERKTDE